MPISAEFQADFSQFSAAVKEATSDLATLEGQAQLVDASMATLAYQAGQGMLQIGEQVADAASTFLDSYAEEEEATRRLISALEAQGTASADVQAAYAAMATQFQKTTRYSDDAITSAQAVFTTIGRVGPEQMQPAITAAANLASTLNVDLNTAAQIIAKTIGSGGEQLGKLSKVLGDVDLKGKSAAEILQLLNDTMGPAAVAQADTFTGQQAILANQMDDMKGKIGALMAEALTPMLELFLSLNPTLQTVIGGTIALGTAFAPVAITLAALVPTLTTLIPLIGTALVGAFSALLPFLGPVGLIAAGAVAIYLAFRNWDKIVEICATVYNGIKTWLVDKFNALVASVLAPIHAVVSGFQAMYNTVVAQSIVPDMIRGIGDQFSQLDKNMVAPCKTACSQVVAAFNEAGRSAMAIITDTGGVARDAFGRIVVAGGAVGLAKTMGQHAGSHFGAVNITINGSVLSNKDEIARVVGDSVMNSYRTGGSRVPV